MKFSRFNIWSFEGQGLILFNSLTGAIALFEGIDAQAMSECLSKDSVGDAPAGLLDEMKEDGYIVSQQVDEWQKIREARLKRMSLVDEYSLCIALNMKCNFNCAYCFELITGESLPIGGVDRISSFFRKISGQASKIEVDWFGGEPLLSFPILKKLNDEFLTVAKSRELDYSCSVTTNGFFLTKGVVDYLVGTSSVSRAVITLDGPPDLHNKSRPLKNGGETFWTILGNIQNAVSQGLSVLVRVNASQYNIGRISELYTILEERGLKNKVRVNIQGVVSSPSKPCEEYCLSGYDLAHQVLEIYEKMAESGWIVLPSTRELIALGFCVGEYPNRYIVDIKGGLCRCSQSLGSGNMGKTLPDGSLILDEEANRTWKEKDPLSFPKCRNCSFLPICMGGCNLKRETGDPCLDWSHDPATFLRVLALNEENLDRERSLS